MISCCKRMPNTRKQPLRQLRRWSDPDAAIVAASGDPLLSHQPGSEAEAIMLNVEPNSDVALEKSSNRSSSKSTLTDIEVASRLGVSRFTVRSWRLKGMGPRFLKMGRAVRYRPQDVDDYERQALVETQAQSDHATM